jgi:ABC-type spermidine/putrescine transport system permease subunit II
VSPPAKAWSWLRRNALPIYAGLAVLYMLIPIAVVAVFSFGATPKDKLTFALDNGFTLEYWKTMLDIP